jgi:hypothetical protein
MPFTPSQLKSEILTDSTGMGTKALVATSEGGTGTATQDITIAGLLNATTGNGASAVYNNAVTLQQIISCIAAADFAAATALQLQKLQFLFAGSATLDATIANNRTIVLAIFSGASTATLNALTAIASRACSRAEALWGAGTVIGQADVSMALRGR